MCSAFNDITACYFLKKKKQNKTDVDIEFTEEGVLQYFDVHMYLFFLF